MNSRRKQERSDGFRRTTGATEAEGRGRRANPKRVLLFITLLGLIATLVIGCDDVVDDPTFRMWCGESLCSWKLERGQVRRAPTWHKKDHGVELVDMYTAISQETTKSPTCLEITTLADVELSSAITIGLDFNRDGTIDEELPIATTAFREVKVRITPPLAYDGIRFVITKRGFGRSVLAQLRVQSTSECSAQRVQLKDLALGSPCSGSLGGVTEECHSGTCCEGICSDCCGGPERDAGAACGEGDDAGVCERRTESGLRPNGLRSVPYQCDPGRRKKPKDAECLADDDCASGVCEGELTPAARVERIADGFIPCESSFPDAGHPDCVFGAIRAGRCL